MDDLDPEVKSWSTGCKVDVEDVEGETRSYFLKVIDRERADEMAQGEFESVTALMSYIPEALSAPITWGTFQNDRSRSFYLTHFRETTNQLPEMSDLLPLLTRLHRNSVSPTGKFGFHVTTFYGPPPMNNTWTDSWEEYYTREFHANLAYCQVPIGRDEELTELGAKYAEKVLPRLLRPMETGGRKIKPTLCFGDLWDANVQTDTLTGKPFLYDPCCFYGHMDFQCMRADRNMLGPKFVAAYLDEIGPSEPVDDFDDRNVMYSIRNNLQTIGMWPQWAPSLLVRIKREMKRLIEKYPNGYDDFVEPNISVENPTETDLRNIKDQTGGFSDYSTVAIVVLVVCATAFSLSFRSLPTIRRP